MPDVLVVGAGPVGMLLAGELHRRGVDVELYERRPTAGAGSRAIGIHPPVLAALEPGGATDSLLAHAHRVPRGEARAGGRMLGTVRFDRLRTRFPFVATLPQARTEEVLAAAAPEPLRGAMVSSLMPRTDGVRVRAGIGGRPTEIDVPLVVVASGAGGRGLAYRDGAVGVHEYPDRYVMSDVPVADAADGDTAVVHLDAGGVLESFPLPGGLRRFVAWDDPHADSEPEALAERLRRALTARGERSAAEAVTTASSFRVRRAVAPALRRGRLFVIGDAAHEVSPIGGQGMNLGMLDAATLAPLLAQWVQRGTAPDDALRTWELRRVESARRAARLAAVNTALGRPRGRTGDFARRTAVRAMLSRATGGAFARAYAMGFDLHA